MLERVSMLNLGHCELRNCNVATLFGSPPSPTRIEWRGPVLSLLLLHFCECGEKRRDVEGTEEEVVFPFSPFLYFLSPFFSVVDGFSFRFLSAADIHVHWADSAFGRCSITARANRCRQEEKQNISLYNVYRTCQEVSWASYVHVGFPDSGKVSAFLERENFLRGRTNPLRQADRAQTRKFSAQTFLFGAKLKQAHTADCQPTPNGKPGSFKCI